MKLFDINIVDYFDISYIIHIHITRKPMNFKIYIIPEQNNVSPATSIPLLIVIFDGRGGGW